jgi:transcriptional regulator with XRE-family HTH domain
MARASAPGTVRSAFAERIRKLREAKRMNQEAFAEMLGVSRSRVAGWETDDSFIRHPEVAKLKVAFSVDADFILFGETAGLTPPCIDWLKANGVI